MNLESPYSESAYNRLATMLGSATCKSLGLFVIPDDFLLSVVIPVYNEEKTLASLVKAVAAVPIRKQILLVDDASKDESRAVMQEIAASFDLAFMSYSLKVPSLISTRLLL